LTPDSELRRYATGHIRLVRYADDYVPLFERRADAEEMQAAMVERLAKFGLQLHEAKTRLIEFGRFADVNRRRRGERRPETFDFLGFTHYCGKSREGRFRLVQKTQRKRMMRRLKELRQELRCRMHSPVRDQQKWLRSVLIGHYAYFGIPGNSAGIADFLNEATKAWIATLRRRGQRPKLPWERVNSVLLQVFPLPPALIRGWMQPLVA